MADRRSVPAERHRGLDCGDAVQRRFKKTSERLQLIWRLCQKCEIGIQKGEAHKNIRLTFQGRDDLSSILYPPVKDFITVCEKPSQV